MNKKENIKYMLELYQTRSQLLAKGITQPVKFMIELGLWKKNDNDHNYLSGRIVNKKFLKALNEFNYQTEEVL